MKFKKLIGTPILTGIILFVGFVFSITLALGNQEISNPDISFQVFLFSTILVISSVGYLTIFVARFFLVKDNIYGDSFGFFSIGEKPSLSYFKRFTPLQLALLIFIILSSLFLVANIAHFKGFTSAKFLPQQFSPIDSLLFSTLLIPSAEESLAMFVTAMAVLFIVIIAIKYKLRKSDFLVLYYGLVPLTVGILAVVWHSNVYKGSDIALFAVFLFWGIKTLSNLAIGYFVFGWIFHSLNNFFIDFTRLYSSDTLLYITIGIIILASVIYVLVYKGRLLGTTKKKEGLL